MRRENVGKTFTHFTTRTAMKTQSTDKLTIEHLAPYLPYDLKCYFLKNVKEENKIANLTSVLSIKENPCANLIHPINQVKPILRPLSDITQDDVDLLCEYSDLEDVFYRRKPSSLYFINTEEKTYLEDYVNSLNYLFKNHFDVFLLIDKGLAVDINTI